ncbi:unnamed protein product [Cladocopium goreaui]|uniref:UBA domain-containing protein n=1 Tax=Cladocopium goreaui TaxID=2562237 RepID=A0A9P1BLQ0_9DINO|nr:unnamed protein product [Cladocopium goreaui]
MAMRQPSMQSEDEPPPSKIFPIELFACCPSAIKVLIPGTWMKIQDCTHLILVVGTLACIVEMVRTIAKLISAKCLEYGCVKELLSIVFIAPCVFYILTIINQYDDRLQAKQRAAKMEKENLARSYNDLLSDMDGLLSKSAESSAGLAERTFESKRRDFQRFLERVKERYKVYAGTKDGEQLLRQFKRFCSNWLHVFQECSIDPINYPKKVIAQKDLEDCTSISEVADLCLDRLKKTEVRFISTQRDQDAQLLRKNKNEYRRMTQTERASRLLELPAPSVSSQSLPQGGRKRRLSWLQFGGPRQFYIRSTPTKDAYPKEIRCGCGSMIILSFEHAKLLIGVFAGLCLMAYDIFVLATSKKQRPDMLSKFWEITDLLAAEVCLIVMLSRFEELDIIQQLEREVKELTRQNEQVEKQREKMNEFWSNAQQLTELWLYRTVPRLDLYKEVHNQLEDSGKEDLLNHMAGANQQLEDLERHLGELKDWKQDGQISPETKKQVGKAINEISKENELDKMLEKLEDAVSSKMKALGN